MIHINPKTVMSVLFCVITNGICEDVKKYSPDLSNSNNSLADPSKHFGPSKQYQNAAEFNVYTGKWTNPPKKAKSKAQTNPTKAKTLPGSSPPPPKEYYDSSIVLGPNESIRDYFADKNSKQIAREPTIEELEKRAGPRNFIKPQKRDRATTPKKDADFSSMSPKQLQQQKKQFWENYYKSKRIKVRRKTGN